MYDYVVDSNIKQYCGPNTLKIGLMVPVYKGSTSEHE